MWKLYVCVLLTVACLATGDDIDCETVATTVCEPAKNPPPPPAPKKAKSPKQPPNGNGPTADEQNQICNKAKEQLYKNNPFCASAGNADDGCRQLSESIGGSNCKCSHVNVCSFTTKEGKPAFVCSRDMSGVTLYKGCNNDVSVISEPDKNAKVSQGDSPSKPDKKSQDDAPSSEKRVTDHEQNVICFQAAGSNYKNNPFCTNTGGADAGCQQLSDAIKGTNPSCCQTNVCSFTTSQGSPVYVSSADMSGVTVYKGCHNNIRIISKPDKNSKVNTDSGSGKGGKPSGSPQSSPSDKATYHEQNVICFTAAGDKYKTPFCKNSGGADEGCKLLSDAIKGSNPSCASQNVCQTTTPEGATVYVSSKLIEGATVIKGCHNNVRIVSKPAGGWPASPEVPAGQNPEECDPTEPTTTVCPT